MKPTKIERVETILWERWLLLRVYCEDGTVGIGEAGTHGWMRPAETLLRVCEPYLIGKDPSLIEHHYQYLARHSHFMGAVIHGALAAIDIALWDIKGKRFGVPIYELMGGRTRHKVRCYMHADGDTLDELVEDAQARVRDGFTAIRFTPMTPDYHLRRSTSEWIEDAIARVGAVREAVGYGVDVCVEIHRRMSPTEAIQLGRALEQFRPFFYEDPMLPDSPAIMGDVQRHCGLPIATGERFTTIYEFQQLLEARGCAYVRPDLCLAGGLSGCKKVAAMAEAHHVKVIPHNPLSPISTAACVQLDACIPNFALQEYTGEAEPPKSDLLVEPLKLEDGYLMVPDGPGLGIELSKAAISGRPFEDKVLDTPLHADGSVADR